MQYADCTNRTEIFPSVCIYLLHFRIIFSIYKYLCIYVENSARKYTGQQLLAGIYASRIQRIKFVRWNGSSPGCSRPAFLPASMHFNIHAMFRPSMRMV